MAVHTSDSYHGKGPPQRHFDREFATDGFLSASQSSVSLGMTEGSLEYVYVRLI